MQIIFKNLKEANTKLRLIPSTYATSDLGEQTGAVVKDQGVINMCFSPYVKPVITCADALTGISFAGKVDEMLRGKTINIVTGETSKGVVIPVDAVDPINLFNTRMDGIVSIILAYPTDEGWGFDTYGEATDDVKVEILPLDAADDSLTHWVQVPHIDAFDVNRGINPTMNQDALGISFCMVKYRAEPNISCDGATDQITWTLNDTNASGESVFINTEITVLNGTTVLGKLLPGAPANGSTQAIAMFVDKINTFFGEHNLGFDYGASTIYNEADTSVQLNIIRGDSEVWFGTVTGNGSVDLIQSELRVCFDKKAELVTISCEGAESETGVIEFDGETALTIGENDEFITYSTPNEVVTALRDAGFEVTVIPDGNIPELTKVLMDNTAIPGDIPIDGTHSYVMNAQITHQGNTVDIPYSIALTNPPLAGDAFNKQSVPPVFWLLMVVSQMPEYADIMSRFIAEMALTPDPTDSLAGPTTYISGTELANVVSEDIMKITFTSKVPEDATQHDNYPGIFASRYPNGVTVVSYGKRAISNVDTANLSLDGKVLTYRLATDNKEIGLREINPTNLLTVSDGQFAGTADMSGADNFGRTFATPDGKMVVGCIDERGDNTYPIFGYLANAQGIYEPITLDWGSFTQFNETSEVTITDDYKAIVCTSTSRHVAVLLRQGTTPNYKVVQLYEPYTIDDERSPNFTAIGNDRFIGRSYSSAPGERYYSIWTMDGTGALTKQSEKIEVTTSSTGHTGDVMGLSPARVGTCILDACNDTVVWVNGATNSIVTDRVGMVQGWKVEGSSEVGYNLSATEFYMMQGTPNKVAITSVFGTQTDMYVADFDPTTGTLSNMGGPRRFDSYRAFTYSHEHHVVCVVDLEGKERFYQPDADNILVEIELPLT